MPEEDKLPQEADRPPSNGELAASSDPIIAEAEPSAPADSIAPEIGADAPELQPSRLPYPVVGIGASAGGLEAYIELLKHLPPDTGMSFVLVTHLSPDKKSQMVPLLAAYTAMQVSEVQSGERPERNQVYIIPPNTKVSICGGLLQLEPRSQEDRPPRPVDYFFRSLASDQKNRAIGIVLSGTDSDGALGLRAIKGEGGISIVQQPESARFSDMPRNGIAADHVDLILTPAQIAVELGRLSARFVRPELDSLESMGDDADFIRIVNLLRGVSGIEYRQYKTATLRRRIARRMMLKRLDGLGEYSRFLQRNPEELRELQEDVLISLTRFFRDPEVWDVMKTLVLPALFERRTGDQPVRVWIPGCATGEEAYSIAISLLEHFAGQSLEPAIQIFGTDASERSIDRARLGIYPDSLASDISADRLRRFFVKIDSGYQVAKRVRDLCIFARQNLCNDPPFSKLDLVSCRNVLIYLGPELQRQIISTFHYALRPGGSLLLGGSEAISGFGDLFTLMDSRHKYYARGGAVGAISQGGANLPLRVRMPELKALPSSPAGTQQEGRSDPELQRTADRIVSARYGPPGVVVNERLEILQSRGRIAPYMEMSPGMASLHLLRNVRESIAPQVRDAVHRAIDMDTPVRIEDVDLREGDDPHLVTLEVLPIQSLNSRSRGHLVLFVAPSDGTERERPQALRAGVASGPSDQVNASLRQDLASTKLYMESLLEERDIRNQELTLAGEEIQSANEELQSTNEELQTAKEELQSANEELQTVNEELQLRNAILIETGNDLSNLLNSVNQPVLMLSSELQIRRFTPPAERVMSIRAADIGRPLSEIRLHLKIDNLEELLREVLDTLVTKEIEVQDRDGCWYLMRIRPYRTSENKIEGVLLVLVNTDQLRRSQQDVREARDYAQGVIESVQMPIVVLSLDLKIRTANNAFRVMADLPIKDVQGRLFPDLVGTLWGMEHIRPLLQAVAQAPNSAGFDFEHNVADPGGKTLHVCARTVASDGERVVIVTVQDITHAKRASDLLERERARLSGEVQFTTAELGRTQSELRALAASLFTSQEEERRRVARELHDDINQQLALLTMELEHCYQRLPEDPAGVRERLDALRTRTTQLSDEVRNISHRLHPSILDDLGLPYALKALAEEFGQREGMVATFTRRNVPSSLPKEIAGALYRIAQEALRNVAKHAGRTHAKIALEGSEESIRLEVTDLGEGFDLEESRGGLGLLSMEERAGLIRGRFQVRSALGKGTTVTVDVPLPPASEVVALAASPSF